MNSRKLTYILSILIVLSACSPVKHLQEDEFLLTRVKLIEKEKSEVKNSTEYIAQKPNTKLLGLVRLRLHLNNMFKPNKEHWFARKSKEIGEKPQIYSSVIAQQDAIKIQRHYFDMGYFQNEVVFETNTPFLLKKKRTQLSYSINPGPRFNYRNISYQSETPAFNAIIEKFLNNSKINSGNGYQLSQLEEARSNLSNTIRNNAYYFFADQFIYYEIDSTIDGNLVDVKLIIQNPTKIEGDTNTYIHRRYKIDQVFIQPDYTPNQKSPLQLDSLNNTNYTIIYNKLNYKPQALTGSVLFGPGDWFNQDKLTNTYKQLSSLNGFSTINIQLAKSSIRPNHLDAHVLLQPLPKQSTAIEIEGTHRVGNWGTSLIFSYKNRNIFKGNEILEIKPSLAFETINNITDDNPSLFNTFEYGIETRLSFPRFLLPVNTEGWVPKSYSPVSTISLLINNQQRQDFNRVLMQATFGYKWKEGKFKTHNINLADITFIKLKDGASLDLSKNPFLAALFTDQLITSSSYQFIFNNQELSKSTNFSYFRGGIEWSGNLISLIGKSSQFKTLENGTKTILGSPYAQYLKLDLDYRYYLNFNIDNSLVFRGFLGRGFAYGNSRVLPFGKQFFSGGSNDIRAWTAYQLGPGSFKSDSVSFNTGDIKTTLNLEYRYKIAGNILGALFIDAGNIWNSLKSEIPLESDFVLSDFHKQIAVGAGFGIRYDFGFFILRLDLAQQLKDPSVKRNSGWVLDEFNFSRTRLNLGLGYPF